MLIREVTASLAKIKHPNNELEVGSNVKGDIKHEKVFQIPLNQIKSTWEGSDKKDPSDLQARSNINNIKNQIKKDISKIPPILVRRLPKQNTFQVIDGHHRFFAFQEMNIKKIPAVLLHAGQVSGQKYTEAIAPHGTPENEFQLMVAGVKPAAIVSPDRFKRMYEPVADDYGWFYHRMSIPGVKYDSYVVAVDEKRLTTIVRMITKMNLDMLKGISPDEEYHTTLGRLLGYEDSDIEDFLQSLRDRKKNES